MAREGLAQMPQPCGDDPVAFAQGLLRAIYPELQAKGGYMYLHAEGPFTRHWSMLSEYSVHVKEYPDNAAPTAIVDGPRSRPFVNVELENGVRYRFLSRKKAVGFRHG